MRKTKMILAIAASVVAMQAQAQWTKVGALIRPTVLTDNVSVGTTVNGANIYAEKTAAVNLGIKSTTLSATMFMDKGSATANAAFAYKTLGTTLWNSGMLGNNNFSIKDVVANTLPLVILQTSGNVGLGTAVPKQRLDVNGNIQISNSGIPMGLMTEVGGFTPLLNMSLNFRESNKDTAYRGAAFRIDSRDNNPLFQWINRPINSSVEKINMVLTEAGNLGIGTKTPATLLDVRGVNVNPAITVGTIGGSLGSVWLGNSNHGLTRDSNNHVIMQTAGLGALIFRNGINPTEKMRITSDGNVGIGTTTPTRPLEVGLPNTTLYNSIRVNTNFSAPTQNTGFEIRVQDGGNFNSYRMYCSGFYFRLATSVDGFATAAVDVFRTFPGGFEPVTDNVVNLGDAQNRWKNVWSANGTIQTSDARYKTNVSDLNYGLSAVMKLRPISYQWKDEKMKVGTGTNLGFIAQELETIVPDAVVHTINGNDKETGAAPAEKESYGVKYSELIPVLTKAIQEQQVQIEAQQTQIENQNIEIENLKSVVNSCCEKTTETKTSNSELQTSNTLFQNQPNPFNQSTVISYQLLSDAKNASIVIRGLNGEELKSVTLSNTGKGQITINANQLAQGTYTYTLIVNGKSVDTKLMVVTK